jgi:hypothetical protein
MAITNLVLLFDWARSTKPSSVGRCNCLTVLNSRYLARDWRWQEAVDEKVVACAQLPDCNERRARKAAHSPRTPAPLLLHCTSVECGLPTGGDTYDGPMMHAINGVGRQRVRCVPFRPPANPAVVQPHELAMMRLEFPIGCSVAGSSIFLSLTQSKCMASMVRVGYHWRGECIRLIIWA